MLHQLRELGVRIAMDDFGTGYSSLSYLQSFPFDKIKIDRSFVKDITENAGSLNIVRAVAALANGMGMTTTAEGVETQEQLDTIASEGCTEMQGFLFSRPLPAARDRAAVPGEGQDAQDAGPDRRGLIARTSGASKLAGDLRQHLQQRGAVGGAEQFVETGFVLGGDQLFGARQHRPALVGQHQDVGAAVVGRAHPRAEIAAFQAVEHRHEIRPEDAERVGDLGLVAAGIAVEQQQHRELRRRQLQRRHATQEILEHLQLRALQRIAQQFGQFAELQRGVFSRTLDRLLAGAGGDGLTASSGSLGNSHRSRLAIPIDKVPPTVAGLEVIFDNCYGLYQISASFQLLISDGRRPLKVATGPTREGERPVLNTTIMLFLLQDGITNGAIYALLGLALVLVFAVTRVILIPQGEFVTYGALSYAMLATGQVPGTARLAVAMGVVAFGLDLFAGRRVAASASRVGARLRDQHPAAGRDLRR